MKFLNLNPGEEKSMVPGVLANVPVALTISDDGNVIYEFVFIGEGRDPHTELHPHSARFEIFLPKEHFKMRQPFVACDGRFLTIRLPDDQIYRVLTYEGENWLQWVPLQKRPSMAHILLIGLKNYQFIGHRMMRRAVIITILIFTLIMLSLSPR